jgi:hypothetical protein
MKSLTPVLCLAVVLTVAACLSPRGVHPQPAAAPPAQASAPPQQQDLFASGVRPVLAARCTPCHEPGGRMYATMPFDTPAIVAGHRAGVLRRLKDPAERQAFEAWLATLPPG